MIKLDELLEKRGKSLYWLQQQTGICRYASLWEFANNKMKRYPEGMLDKICEALDCQPGDLIIHVRKRKRRK